MIPQRKNFFGLVLNVVFTSQLSYEELKVVTEGRVLRSKKHFRAICVHIPSLAPFKSSVPCVNYEKTVRL